MGSRVRVQALELFRAELNFLDVSFGSRVRFQALELFSMELNFLSVSLDLGFGSAWFNSPKFMLPCLLSTDTQGQRNKSILYNKVMTHGAST